MKTLFTPTINSSWITSVTCNESNFVTIYELIRIKTSHNSGISYSKPDGQRELKYDYELKDWKESPQNYEFLYEIIDRRVKDGKYLYFLIQFANGLELIVSSSEELKKLLNTN